MNRRWLVLVGVIAFAVTLAVVVGNRLATTGALVVAFGIAVGVVVGVTAALLIIRPGARHPGQAEGCDTTTVVLPSEQADLLIRMLNSRRQADPDAFPMVAERERQFSSVGGASLDAAPEDQ